VRDGDDGVGVEPYRDASQGNYLDTPCEHFDSQEHAVGPQQQATRNLEELFPFEKRMCQQRLQLLNPFHQIVWHLPLFVEFLRPRLLSHSPQWHLT
jgi:hypothetical protein